MTCSLSDLFFCKQKTAYEWRISDWSSDVCSSDLQIALRVLRERVAARPRGCAIGVERPGHHRVDADLRAVLLRERRRQDRESVVYGKRVSVRVAHGGRRDINKKTTRTNYSRTLQPPPEVAETTPTNLHVHT